MFHFSVLHALFMVTLCDLVESSESDRELAYNNDLADRFQSDYEQLNANERKSLLHKIGVLAMYFRIYKALVPLAGSEVGYLYRFPEPTPSLDEKLSQNCESGLDECITEILSIIQTSHAWVYPSTSQGKRETPLNAAVLKDVISDNLLSTEITATHLLCFFTLRRVTAFERIPFCRFRLQENSTKVSWPGYLLQKSPQMIDEYIGAEYECAYESFCPNPCCTGVPTFSPEFLSRKCKLNKCVRRDRCRILAHFNDYFPAIRRNRWNISCPCGHGLMYRSDVETCVHADLCSDENRCSATFECVNTIADPGYKCVCQLGYVKGEYGKCHPINMSSAHWHGFAFSEPHPKSSSGVSQLVACALTLAHFLRCCLSLHKSFV